MPITVNPTPLDGVFLIKPRTFSDARGFFLETMRSNQLPTVNGESWTFVQDNHSRSTRGVLRGFHYQLEHPQGKLVYAVRGTVEDAVVDIRRGSPTFGHTYTATLSDENHHLMLIAPGFAHAFCVLSNTADIMYKCTDYYHADDQYGVQWNDPNLNMHWPLSNPILSEADTHWPQLQDIDAANLPVYNTP